MPGKDVGNWIIPPVMVVVMIPDGAVGARVHSFSGQGLGKGSEKAKPVESPSRERSTFNDHVEGILLIIFPI